MNELRAPKTKKVVVDPVTAGRVLSVLFKFFDLFAMLLTSRNVLLVRPRREFRGYEMVRDERHSMSVVTDVGKRLTPCPVAHSPGP